MEAAVQRFGARPRRRKDLISCLLILDVLIMHSPVYLAICAATLVGLLIIGTPDLNSMVFASAMAIAVLGVPHGGLDHWTGRRLLHSRFVDGWWIVFFPVYLFVGLVFAVGWFVIPTITVVSFFLISAWHFGREDQRANPQSEIASRTRQVLGHIFATALGGLVIWVPAIARPEEMQSLLSLIVPANGVEPVNRIFEVTRFIAVCLIPLATLIVIARLIKSPRDCNRWVPLATAAIAIYMPILISFSIYFCGWHSWQGLQRLRQDESLTAGQFVRCVSPLSIAAIIGVAAAGLWLQGWSAELLPERQTFSSLRTVFIGLSAIAVPHLLLHEFDLHSRTALRVVNHNADYHNSESCVTVPPHSQHQVCT